MSSQPVIAQNQPLTFAARAAITAKFGIPVMPLEPRGKRAFLNEWQNLGTTDPAQIAKWDKLNPAYNCAALARYDGCWMLDDDTSTLAQKYKDDTGLDLPQTFTVKTARGFHYYFSHDAASRLIRYGGNENSGVIDIPGFKGEARCNNQYVVAPGSVHPSGALYEICDDAPIASAPVRLLEWLQKSYSLSESRKPESDKPKNVGKADPGFRKLFDVVGYRPLISRINALDDARLHVTGLKRGDVVACPMPHHKHGDYTACFGSIDDAPELLHCLGKCQWTGDMVAAVYRLDGGCATYKTMYDAARAICKEEKLNFEDFFPAKPVEGSQTETICAAGTQPELINETEPEIVDEPLPEFPAITGSIQELAEALCPDIPREFKIMAAVTRVGLAISGKVQLEGEPYLQPRFYTCLLGEPGRGKTAAIKETRRIKEGYREVPSVDSAPALIDTFAESNDSPRYLLLSPDEAVDLFEKSKSSRDGRNSLFTELLKLYEDNVTGNRARRNEAPIEIQDAHLAILCGATTSGYDGMWIGSRGAAGGLQSRFIPIATTACPIPAKQRPSDMPRVNAAVDRIRGQINGCSASILKMTPEAEEMFKTWWESVPKDKTSVVRAEALVKRFLMVLGVTNDTDVINRDLMATGISFGEYVIAVRDRFNPADSYSWVQAFEQKIEKCHERLGVPITRDRCRKLVHPDRYPGGYGDFIRAYNNLVQVGRLTVQGKSERASKYGLS